MPQKSYRHCMHWLEQNLNLQLVCNWKKGKKEKQNKTRFQHHVTILS